MRYEIITAQILYAVAKQHSRIFIIVFILYNDLIITSISYTRHRYFKSTKIQKFGYFDILSYFQHIYIIKKI